MKVQLPKKSTAPDEESVAPPPCVHYWPYSVASSLTPDFSFVADVHLCLWSQTFSLFSADKS